MTSLALPPTLPPTIRVSAIAIAILGGVVATIGLALQVEAVEDLPRPFEGATGGQLIVVAMRLVVPLLILRWALLGGVLALVADALDVVIVEFFGPGGMGPHYAQLDRALDTYYLAIEALVAWWWTNPWARNVALFLFAYRAVGFVLFALTEARALLFVFPNVFENWWLYCLIVARFWPSLVPHSWRSTLILLALLLVPKLAQEYVLHVREAQPWNWFKVNVLER